MKLISWNVNGLRAVMKKIDINTYVQETEADILCLQETKVQDGQVSLQLEGYHGYWNYAVKKATQARLFFRKKSRFTCFMDWELTIMIKKDG